MGYPTIQHGHGKRFSTSETSSSLSTFSLCVLSVTRHTLKKQRKTLLCNYHVKLFDDPSITMSLFHDPTIVDCHMRPAMAGHVCGLYSRHIKKSFLSRRQLPRPLQTFQKVLLSLQSLLHAASTVQSCVSGGCRSHDDTGGDCKSMDHL